MENKSISVVIPAYNEEKRLLPTLEKVHAYLSGNYHDFELLVVDDGSADATVRVAGEFAANHDGVRILRNERNMGKGAAIRRGVLASGGEMVLISDADLSTPIEELEKFMPYLEEGYHIVIGSRAMPGADIRIRQPLHREVMGRVFNMFVQGLLVSGVKDTQCGFKLFKGPEAKMLFSRGIINGFSFDAEILFLAQKSGLRIKETPVIWLNSAASTVRVASDPAKMFAQLLVIRLNWLRGRYRA
ncbi:MAG: glycosyltransferase family 2 protein [Nitrospiraceae bacterium]|nr:glycosyltransferase family 2 protein [Nitrospiraceae bacterium]